MRVLLLIVPLLAGCLGSAPAATDTAPDPDPAPALPPGVVVADIGPGGNLYHEAFRRSGPQWDVHPCERVAGMPCDIPSLKLTLGEDYAAGLAADEAVWAAYANDQVYWVEGTNLLVVTHRNNSLEPGHGHSFHGSATQGAVNDACPECYVLVFQDGQSLDGEPLRMIATQMPWVSFVTSTNVPGNLERTQRFFTEGAYAEASRELYDRGGLFFQFAGNTPVVGVSPVPYTHVTFPPWGVLVGGAHTSCGADEATAGHPPEVVGNFSQYLPMAEAAEGRALAGGTSFATPAVAGAFGYAKYLALQAGLNATHVELREAVWQAARYFAPTDYERKGGCFVPIPVGPAPWLQMGWGYVGRDEAQIAVSILAGEEVPDKPVAAVAFMEAHMAAREAMYAR